MSISTVVTTTITSTTTTPRSPQLPSSSLASQQSENVVLTEETERPDPTPGPTTINNVIDRAILPPPFKRTTKTVPDPSQVDLVGEIRVDKDGKLLRKYLRYTGFAQDQIEIYNRWVTHRLPKQITLESFELDEVIERPDRIRERTEIIFNFVGYMPPGTTSVTGKLKPLYPLTARNYGYTHMAKIYVNVKRRGRKSKQIY